MSDINLENISIRKPVMIMAAIQEVKLQIHRAKHNSDESVFENEGLRHAKTAYLEKAQEKLVELNAIMNENPTQEQFNEMVGLCADASNYLMFIANTVWNLTGAHAQSKGTHEAANPAPPAPATNADTTQRAEAVDDHDEDDDYEDEDDDIEF